MKTPQEICDIWWEGSEPFEKVIEYIEERSASNPDINTFAVEFSPTEEPIMLWARDRGSLFKKRWKPALGDKCPECWGTGFYQGWGAPCKGGCVPLVKRHRKRV